MLNFTNHTKARTKPETIIVLRSDAIFNSAGGSGEEECPQCSSKFIRSQGKLDPNNPQNMICQSCFENATSSTATPNVAKSTSSSSSSAVNLYHGGRNLKREKKVCLAIFLQKYNMVDQG